MALGLREAGDPTCQYLFAKTFHDPTRREQSDEPMRRALQWMQLAAQGGHPLAIEALAGLLGAHDPPRAAAMHREAVKEP